MGPSSKSHIFLLILSIYSSTSSSSSVDLTKFIYKGCANQKFQDPSGISSQNLQSLYQTLITQSSSTNFFNTTTGNNQLTTSVTGLYQCRGDLPNSDCNTCVKKIPQTIQKVCGGDTIAARVQLDGCYLRYECEGDLGSADCVSCVRSAVENARSACASSISGQIYLQQCYVSYTYYPNGVPGSGTGGGGGIQTGETQTGGGDGHRNTQKTVAIIIGGLAGLFLAIAFLLVLKSAFKKKKEKHSYYGGY
ncbi:putative Gnk2-like domain-containing protein [Helianthus annuus]|uniref:Gnk2-like domain-containing protein n=1 Tax=Helianthus annuus TaxID=4232 RepID=A0A9K3HUH2_HELAN|nr:putative Gnk2-like domain-containing protein [Helianthus annuus]